MPREAIFQWEGHEYAFEGHGADWYWALGIVAGAIALVAVVFGNILFALVVIAGAAAVGLQAAKHRRQHTFTILENGIAIDDDLYVYEDMRDFSVLEFIDPTLPPALSIKTNHILAPHLLIPIHDYDPDEVYEYVNIHIPEGDHRESVIDRIMHALKL